MENFRKSMEKFAFGICQKLSIDYFNNKEMVEQAIELAIWKTNRDYDPEKGKKTNYGYLKLMGELWKAKKEWISNVSIQEKAPQKTMTYEEREVIEIIKKKIGSEDWDLISRVLQGEITRTEAGKIRGCSGEYISQIIKKCQKIAKKIS